MARPPFAGAAPGVRKNGAGVEEQMAETRQEEQQVDSKFSALAGKYLTFVLDKEEYGLDIMKVQEIIGLIPITVVPRVAEYVRGVINLRGRIVPTVDLRRKFGLAAVEDTDRTCIIVVEVESPRGKIKMGIIVDQVAEVLDINARDINQPPDFGTSLDTAFILAIGVVKGQVKILLDVDKVLTTDEVRAVETIAEN